MAERKPKQRGMGRGLAAILATDETLDGTSPGPELRTLAVELITPNPHQPRRVFEEEALQALAGSIADRGVLQPILVRPLPGGHYELVAGERRWRASQLAGLTEVPALVQDQDDATSLQSALVENMARADLNPVEEARAVAALVEDLGITREAVGRMVGRSRVAISNLLRILDLPDEALDLIGDGALSEGHGRALLLADGHEARRALARDAADEGWSVRVLEQRARAASDGARARKPAVEVPADQAAAADELSQRLARVLGHDVRVRAKGDGFVAEIRLEDVDDARRLTDRLGA
ncbi:Chromosome (plasmid) partitioning protein ParB [Patulibacter medicamentivorans]|uniref:Chromosome (Plasmid) partitioning protein ParB n=1 Tax=Patulibacter medicamentivorans TaxID=1097667 RepID=H0E9K2_9ACTN|nr:ParB/RepB/Spo0J family partition protein [Patulibacter medicamentivorans]EHN09644.1 Chromosome (plasmid) partitioning protein ParB [Patulibacter medicamentivorans]